MNWIHNTENDLVRMDNSYVGISGNTNLGELKLGIEGQVSKNSYAWFNISYQKGSHDNTDVIGNFGWKFNF